MNESKKQNDIVLHRIVNKWWNTCMYDPRYENQLKFEKELKEDIAKNYTPNTEVQKRVEKGIRGFLKSKVGKLPNGSPDWEDGFSDGWDFMINKLKEYFGITTNEPAEKHLKEVEHD